MTLLRYAALCVLGLSIIIAAGCKKEVKDNRGTVQLTSTPPGATVTIGNEEIATTPTKTMKVAPRPYLFKLSKTNYQTEWVKVECPLGENKTIDVQLTPVTASVMLRSTPSAAKVEIDDKIIGETPMILTDQSIGTHSVILKKPGYVPQKATWTIESARPQLVQVQLGSNVGTLKVSSVPSQASIFIDGKPNGETPFSEKIEQGQHQIKVEKPGYAPYEKVVLVTKEQLADVKIDLQILPSSIVVTSNPPGAAVFLNNRQYENTPTEIKNLQPGNYVVKLEKAGCDPASRELTLPPGQSIEVALNLDSNTGGIDLVANPPGVTVYVDGKKIGVTEPSEAKGISKVISLRNLSAENHIVVVTHKRAVPEKKEISVTVEKGKISRPKSIELWIPNTVLTHKDGRVSMGRIIMETETEITFEPEPRVKQTYKKNEIKEIKPLSTDDI